MIIHSVFPLESTDIHQGVWNPDVRFWELSQDSKQLGNPGPIQDINDAHQQGGESLNGMLANSVFLPPTFYDLTPSQEKHLCNGVLL